MAIEHRITDEILRKALGVKHEAHAKDVVIKESKVTAGANKGDGYTCDINRVHVSSEIRGQAQQDTLICKCVPPTEEMMYFMKEILLFRREVYLYMDIIPRLNKIALANDLEPIQVPSVYYGDEDEGVMVMEDLKESGFDIKDKTQGLDVPHMKLFLGELAKLHALSYHWIETYFGGLERLKKDYWPLTGDKLMSNDNPEIVNKFKEALTGTFSLAVAIVEETPEDQEHLEPLREFCRVEFFAKNEEIYKPKGPFNCFLHGDAWLNNAMFRDNADGSAADVSMIDFQGSRRARPTLDLAYLLVSSMSTQLRAAHLEELLKFYHEKLKAMLTHFGYAEDLYTLEQLKKDYQDCFGHAFMMGLTHAQVQCTNPDDQDHFDFKKMMSEDGEKHLEAYRQYQRKQAKTNVKMRTRMLDLIHEAREMQLF